MMQVCIWNVWSTGSGTRKKDAKKEAAKDVLSHIEKAGVCIIPTTRAQKKVCIHRVCSVK